MGANQLAKPGQSFFIPESIERLRLSDFPRSPALAAALRRLRSVSFGDLRGVGPRDFQRLGEQAAVLYLELGELVQRVRQGDFAGLAAMNPAGVPLDSVSGGLAPFPQPGRATAGVIPVRKAGKAPPSSGDPEIISIPKEAREKPLIALPLSVRLRHVLWGCGFRVLGDLRGIAYSQVLKRRNCGKKTIRELRQLVDALTGGPVGRGEDRVKVQTNLITIPARARDLSPDDLPVSVRLEGVLKRKGISHLGDLDGLSETEILFVRSCGQRTLAELRRVIERVAAGDFDASDTPFDPAQSAELLRSLDRLIEKLRPRERRALLARFGIEGGRVLTLARIGTRLKLTRERVRQIEETTLEFLRREGGPKLTGQLRGITAICLDRVCPLTPALLSRWVGRAGKALRLPVASYVRLLGGLDPQLPAWPDGQEPSQLAEGLAIRVRTALEEILRTVPQGLPLGAAWRSVRSHPKLRHLAAGDFLAVLKRLRSVEVDLSTPDQPAVRIGRLSRTDLARFVLKSAPGPLTPEEILACARAQLGGDYANWKPRALGTQLTSDKGFYLLGPRTYGLRQHFRLPERVWPTVREDVQRLLAEEKRPTSTSEIVRRRKFRWTVKTNAREIAQILRTDRRFVDLGRFLFGLAAWDVGEREQVKDLIPRVLAEAGRPLTTGQVLERLQRCRSICQSSISSPLRENPLVREFGFGYYGLKSWGESVMERVVTDPALVERVIRRIERPLSFRRVCEILEIPTEGALADKLWETVILLRPGAEREPASSGGSSVPQLGPL